MTFLSITSSASVPRPIMSASPHCQSHWTLTKRQTVSSTIYWHSGDDWARQHCALSKVLILTAGGRCTEFIFFLFASCQTQWKAQGWLIKSAALNGLLNWWLQQKQVPPSLKPRTCKTKYVFSHRGNPAYNLFFSYIRIPFDYGWTKSNSVIFYRTLMKIIVIILCQ